MMENLSMNDKCYPKTSKSNFFAEIAKPDHKLSKTFYYQNIICFG